MEPWLLVLLKSRQLHQKQLLQQLRQRHQTPKFGSSQRKIRLSPLNRVMQIKKKTNQLPPFHLSRTLSRVFHCAPPQLNHPKSCLASNRHHPSRGKFPLRRVVSIGSTEILFPSSSMINKLHKVLARERPYSSRCLSMVNHQSRFFRF